LVVRARISINAAWSSGVVNKRFHGLHGASSACAMRVKVS
jgi:ribosomal protein L21E